MVGSASGPRLHLRPSRGTSQSLYCTVPETRGCAHSELGGHLLPGRPEGVCAQGTHCERRGSASTRPSPVFSNDASESLRATSPASDPLWFPPPSPNLLSCRTLSSEDLTPARPTRGPVCQYGPLKNPNPHIRRRTAWSLGTCSSKRSVERQPRNRLQVCRDAEPQPASQTCPVRVWLSRNPQASHGTRSCRRTSLEEP